MLHLHIPKQPYLRLSGRMTHSENGHNAMLRTAFEGEGLIGFHVDLPRRMGCFLAELTFLADGKEPLFALPLVWCGASGATEYYAVLVDTASLGQARGHLFYHLSFSCAHGRFYALAGSGGELLFTHEKEKASAFPLLFPAYLYPPTAQTAGGAVYACPLSVIGAGEEEMAAFFEKLMRLQVCALWLMPSREDTAQRLLTEEVLTPALVAHARQAGIRLLPDFWMASGLRGGVTDEGWEEQVISNEDGTPRLEDCAASPPLRSLASAPTRSCCEYFCGSDGVVSRWLGAGADGFVLREADRLGDAFIAAVRYKMEEVGERKALLGAVQEDPSLSIAFGMRRRFCLGEEFDGFLPLALREAALSYLLDGQTESLRHCLTAELPNCPPRLLHNSWNLPATYAEDGRSLLQNISLPHNISRETVEELAALLAATLPGSPVIPDATVEGESLLYHLRLAVLRRREPVYESGDLRLIHLDSELLIFSREREGEALLTFLNRSPRTFSLEAPGGFSVVLGGRGRKTKAVLAAGSGLVCKFSYWQGERHRLTLTPSVLRTTAVQQKAPI